MRRLLFIISIFSVVQNAFAFNETDSTQTEKVIVKNIIKQNALHSLDTTLIYSTLLDPEEDLFAPSFFAVNSGLYKFPVLLNTDDFGWKSKYFMMVFDTIDFKVDTVPVLTAKYDHGYPTTHWFTADFKRAIGKSKISAKFNRNASEPLYNNTRGIRNNFAFGAELPFRDRWKVQFSYFRNQASISENGGIYNKDSLAVVDEFTIANIFSNLNTAQNNLFDQRINLNNEFTLLSKFDSITEKNTFLNLGINGGLAQNKYDFSMEERDIDSAFFDINYLDTTSTFDSVGFEKIIFNPSISFGKKGKTTANKFSAGINKEWHNYDFLNNSFAYISGNVFGQSNSYGFTAQYHFENSWENNYKVQSFSSFGLSKKLNETTKIYQTNIKLVGEYSAETPSYLFLNYFGNHHQWNNSFKPISRLKLNSVIDLAAYNTIIDIEFQNLNDFIYLDLSSLPQQTSEGINTAKIHLKNEIGNKWLKLKTGLIYQNSSNDIIRIPPIVTRSTLSFHFNYRTLPFTIGGTFNYFSKYTGLNYNPAIRHYHLGSQSVGGTPVVDWFFAGRIGPADLYVKYDNSFYLLNRQLFIGENYPIYKQYLRFGLKWKLKN